MFGKFKKKSNRVNPAAASNALRNSANRRKKHTGGDTFNPWDGGNPAWDRPLPTIKPLFPISREEEKIDTSNPWDDEDPTPMPPAPWERPLPTIKPLTPISRKDEKSGNNREPKHFKLPNFVHEFKSGETSRITDLERENSDLIAKNILLRNELDKTNNELVGFRQTVSDIMDQNASMRRLIVELTNDKWTKKNG